MIKLSVNGVGYSFDGDEDMPLLWYLRDVAGMKGTKFGCGAAQCGACTVHQDGMAIRSCVTPMAALDGAEITTIEGIGSGHMDGMHPLQKAWVEYKVPQCGYCQAGQIMQAASLLADSPNPSDEDIDGAMWGNICRCGTYPRIKAAIKSVAGQSSEGGE